METYPPTNSPPTVPLPKGEFPEGGMQRGEVEVVLSLLPTMELGRLREAVEFLIASKVYEGERFPLSCGGLRFLLLYISEEIKGRSTPTANLTEEEEGEDGVIRPSPPSTTVHL